MGTGKNHTNLDSSLSRAPDRDGLARTGEAVALGLLKSTIIVEGTAADAAAYYQELRQDVAARLTDASAGQEAGAYLEGLADKWNPVVAELAKADIFTPLDPSAYGTFAQERLEDALSFVRLNAPLAKGEDEPLPTYTLGMTTRGAGPVAAGTLVVRKAGRAVSHYVMPEWVVDTASRSVASVAASTFAASTFAALGEDGDARAEERALPAILPAFKVMISKLGVLLKRVPWKNIIDGIAEGKFGIDEVIAGLTDEGTPTPPTLEEIKDAVKEAMREISGDNAIHDEVAHIETFMDALKSHQYALQQSKDQKYYIEHDYLPFIASEAMRTGAGKVRNSIGRLKNYHAAESDKNYEQKQKFIGPIASGIGTYMLIHRTHTMLHLALAGYAKKENNREKFEFHRRRAWDALSHFEYAVYDSAIGTKYLWDLRLLSPQIPIPVESGILKDYQLLTQNIGWDRDFQVLWFLYYTVHYAKNDERLDSCKWALTSQGGGQEWAENTVRSRKEEYGRKAMEVVNPIKYDIMNWREGYHSLKQNIGPVDFGLING